MFNTVIIITSSLLSRLLLLLLLLFFAYYKRIWANMLSLTFSKQGTLSLNPYIKLSTQVAKSITALRKS